MPTPMNVQWVRLVDVFLLGPLMVWFGVAAKDMPPWARAALVASGVSTSVFNGINYVRLRREGVCVC
jgi:hypothetical protein